MNLSFVKLNLAELEDAGEISGFPLKEYLMCHPDKKGDCIWVPEPTVDTYKNLGYNYMNQHRMSYAAPEWMIGKGEGGILLLDDSNRASLSILQAAMNIIDRQSFVSWTLPKGWTVITTNNPSGEDYQVTMLDKAHESRKITLESKFDHEVWAEWAEENGIPNVGINFIMKYPEVVDGVNPEKKDSPNIRLWTKFFLSLKWIKDLSTPEAKNFIYNVGQKTLGVEATGLVTQFITDGLDKLPDVNKCLDSTDSNESIVKQFRDSMYINKGEYRADIAYIIEFRLLNVCAIRQKNNNITERAKEVLYEILGADLFQQDTLMVTATKINAPAWGLLKKGSKVTDLLLAS